MPEINPSPSFDQNDRAEGWRRVRVGVTGVAAILLMIGLASAMLSRIASSSQGAPPVAATVNAENAAPGAQLGVEPAPVPEATGVVPPAQNLTTPQAQ